MNRIRTFAIAVVMTFALVALAQQATMPSVDDHLKMLTTGLSLTAEQQAKIRPVLEEMMAGMQDAKQDSSLSNDARHEKMKAIHMKADKDARKYLTEEQKQKLDAMENDAHSGAHDSAH